MNHARQRDRQIARAAAHAKARKSYAPVGPDAATQAAIRTEGNPFAPRVGSKNVTFEQNCAQFWVDT